jgi:CRISPR-associated protein Cas2
MMLLYLVTYDISNDRRRKKVSDILEGYGRRVQYSVFECRLPREKYREMKDRLMKVVNVEKDGFRIYPISAHTIDQVEVWCGNPITEFPKSRVI